MKYSYLEGLTKPVSRIVLGTAVGRFQFKKDCDEVLDKAFALGINTIDTARCYMGSESVVGDYVRRKGLQDKTTFIVKGADNGFFGKRVNEKCIRGDLQTSLKNLGISCADIYFLHRDDESKDVGEIMDVLNALKAEGKINLFGGSNWHANRIEQANEYAYKHNMAPMSASQPQYSLAVAFEAPWKGCLSATGELGKADRAWYADTAFPVFAYSPLGRGFLSGRYTHENAFTEGKKYMDSAARRAFLHEENVKTLARAEEVAKELGISVPTLATAWVMQSKMNVYTIVGSGRAESLESVCKALDVKFTEDQLKYLGNLE